MRKQQDDEEDFRIRFFQMGPRPPWPSRRVLYEKARLRAAQDETAEAGQVAVARDLLRLLPTHSFSLIVYPCVFFMQVPLCPEDRFTPQPPLQRQSSSLSRAQSRSQASSLSQSQMDPLPLDDNSYSE